LIQIRSGGLVPHLTGKPLDKERGSDCRKACDYMLVIPHPQDAAPVTPKQAPRVVLDTNAVLDWLWFGDDRIAPLAAALNRGRLCWVASSPMRNELVCVLDRLAAASATHSKEHALTSFDRWATIVQPAPVFERLRCTDADDQKFIDLALATGAAWLISRDRAVLRLARRAGAFGLAIVTPERWR
jgi:putative PIN family toxin of toxin-antitoxin system